MSEALIPELIALLGEDDFIALAEARGGTRLYVPADPNESDLPDEIGMDATVRLSKEWPCGFIKVPLARQFRVIHYVKRGMSNRAIAQRFGMTESGVERLLKRVRENKPVLRPRKKDPRQIEMF